MKKLLKITSVFLLSIMLFSCSNEEDLNQRNFKKVEPPVYYQSKAEDPISCQSFTVGMNIGIAFFETTVYYCCAGDMCIPFPAGSCANCGVVSEEDYNDYKQGNLNKGKSKKKKLKFIKHSFGFYIQDALEKQKRSYIISEEGNNAFIDEISIVSSTTMNVKGKQRFVKKGKYKVDDDGFVSLQLISK